MFAYWQYLHVKIRCMLAEGIFTGTRDILVEVKSKSNSFYLLLCVSLIFAAISPEFFS